MGLGSSSRVETIPYTISEKIGGSYGVSWCRADGCLRDLSPGSSRAIKAEI